MSAVISVYLTAIGGDRDRVVAVLANERGITRAEAARLIDQGLPLWIDEGLLARAGHLRTVFTAAGATVVVQESGLAPPELPA
jgi:hypothetical protein